MDTHRSTGHPRPEKRCFAAWGARCVAVVRRRGCEHASGIWRSVAGHKCNVAGDRSGQRFMAAHCADSASACAGSRRFCSPCSVCAPAAGCF